jgi:DNA modification methylase
MPDSTQPTTAPKAKAALRILEGCVRATLPQLAPQSVHCAITSPPYWALRSYLPSDSPLKHLERGCEPTPHEYIDNLVADFRGVRRVLRDDGTLWVNLGETWCNAKGTAKNPGGRVGPNECLHSGHKDAGAIPLRRPNKSDADNWGIGSGSRVLIPERFALAMQADGWLLRDVVIWHKLSPMPTSVDGWRWVKHRVKVKGCSAPNNGGVRGANIDGGWTAETHPETRKPAEWKDCPGCPKCSPNDGLVLMRGSWRTTCAHEYIFMFAKRMNYFCDAEAVAEEAATSTIERNEYSRVNDDADEQFAVRHDHEFAGLTRNPRSVRQFRASFYGGKHYAAFPISIPDWCIRAATSDRGVCAECGAPWARVIQAAPPVGDQKRDELDSFIGSRVKTGPDAIQRMFERGEREVKTLGWRATCACTAADPIPATVLDCFGGTGTTAEASLKLGRRAVLCELNPDYIQQIRERIGGSVPLFAGATP